MLTNAVRGSSQNCISKLQLYELPLHTQWWLQTTNVVKKYLSRCLGIHSHHCPCCELLTIVLLEDSFNAEFTNMSNA